MYDLKVSIITPNLNSGIHLEQTILSVLNQTYKNIEYIIVDGGSTDGSKKIIEKYKNKISKVIIEKDENMYQAINKGIKIANGDIISWLNSDDLYFPNAIENAVEAFKFHDCEWIVGKVSKKIGDRTFTYPFPFYYPQKKILNKECNKMNYGCIPQESVLFKKSLYIKSGGLNLKKKLSSDFLLWVEFSKYAKLVTINKKIGIFRVLKNQLSSNQTEYYNELNMKYKYKFNIYRIIYSFVRFIFSRK